MIARFLGSIGVILLVVALAFILDALGVKIGALGVVGVVVLIIMALLILYALRKFAGLED